MLDEQVRDHQKNKGKEPHFGSEKTLYKLQDQVLDLTGPLTCLWADTEARIKRENVILLVQRVLFLMANFSNSITREQRQIAWSQPNPVIKDRVIARARRVLPCLMRALWRRPPKKWRMKRLWQNSPAHKRKH